MQPHIETDIDILDAWVKAKILFWLPRYIFALIAGYAIVFVLIINLIAVAYIVNGNVQMVTSIVELAKWICL